MEKLKIIANTEINYLYPLDIMFGFHENLEIFTEKKSLIGIGGNYDSICDEVINYPEYFKMFLFPEEPNLYHSIEDMDYIRKIESTFNLIFDICPYTNIWREKYFNSPKRINAFFPYDIKYTFPSENKEIDVYWTGTSKPGTFIDIIQSIISKFNHRIVNFRTVQAISHEEKLKLNGKSKISITYGTLFSKNEYGNLHHLDNWRENEAFSNYFDSGLIPQMKNRTYEAAFSKSIILNKRDPWNVIEDWFEPEKEFLYYDNEIDLEEKIHHILNNYGDYYHIAENAYNRAINNYTTQHFIDKYIIPNTGLEM